MTFSVAPRAFVKDLDADAYFKRGQPYTADVHTMLFGEAESLHAQTQNRFSRNKSLRGCTYIGAGGWVNLGYIAALQPSRIILFDINANQTRYWRRIIPAVINSSNGTDAINAHNDLTGFVLRGERHGSQRPVLEQLENNQNAYGMCEKSFPVLKETLRKTELLVLTADIRDAALWRTIKPALPFDKPRVAYFSNIFHFTSSNLDFAMMPSGPEGHQAAYEQAVKLAFGEDRSQPGVAITAECFDGVCLSANAMQLAKNVTATEHCRRSLRIRKLFSKAFSAS